MDKWQRLAPILRSIELDVRKFFFETSIKAAYKP
jgi:hypothetical protein